MESYKTSQQESNKYSERLQRLIDSRKEVDGLADKLGLGIDEGIKESVALLRAMGYPTTSSCAGHTNEDNDGYGIPYIQIYAPAPVGWRENEEKQKLWTQENIKYRDRLAPLVEEFYKDRNVQPDVQIYLARMGKFWGFRLTPLGKYMKDEELGVKTQEDAVKKIRAYQQEMAELIGFLKKKYFEQTT